MKSLRYGINNKILVSMANDYVAVEKVLLSALEEVDFNEIGLAFLTFMYWANGDESKAKELFECNKVECEDGTITESVEAKIIFKLMKCYAGRKMDEYKRKQETNRENANKRWQKEREDTN